MLSKPPPLSFHIAGKWALWSVSSLKTSALTLCFSWAPATLKEVSWQAGQVWKTTTASKERYRQTDRQKDRPVVMQLFQQLLSLWTGSQGVVTLKPCLPALPALSSCEPLLHLTKQPQNPQKHAGNLQKHGFLKFKSQTLLVCLLSEVGVSVQLNRSYYY